MDSIIDELTVNQIKLMQHAIGFYESDCIDGTIKIHRNYYSAPQSAVWEQLIDKGLASKSNADIDGNVQYSVTQNGIRFLSGVFGIKLERGN